MGQQYSIFSHGNAGMRRREINGDENQVRRAARIIEVLEDETVDGCVECDQSGRMVRQVQRGGQRRMREQKGMWR
jgi:hypothetical protein